MPENNTYYSQSAYDSVSLLLPKIRSVSSVLNISPAALYGALVEERSDYDDSMWALLKNIESDGYAIKMLSTQADIVNDYDTAVSKSKLDDHTLIDKFSNPVLMDVGPYNIKLGTAIRLLRKYNEAYPDKDPLLLKKYNDNYTGLLAALVTGDPVAVSGVAGLAIQEGNQYMAEKADPAYYAMLSQAEKDGLAITFYNFGEAAIERRRKININENGGVYAPGQGEGTGGGVNHLYNSNKISEILGIENYNDIGDFKVEEYSERSPIKSITKLGLNSISVVNTNGEAVIVEWMDHSTLITRLGANFQPTDAFSVHRVQSGDTLSAISLREGLSIDLLMAANPQITDADKIIAGEALRIPEWVLPGGGGFFLEDGSIVGENQCYLPAAATADDFERLTGFKFEDVVAANTGVDFNNRQDSQLLNLPTMQNNAFDLTTDFPTDWADEVNWFSPDVLTNLGYSGISLNWLQDTVLPDLPDFDPSLTGDPLGAITGSPGETTQVLSPAYAAAQNYTLTSIYVPGSTQQVWSNEFGGYVTLTTPGRTEYTGVRWSSGSSTSWSQMGYSLGSTTFAPDGSLVHFGGNPTTASLANTLTNYYIDANITKYNFSFEPGTLDFGNPVSFQNPYTPLPFPGYNGPTILTDMELGNITGMSGWGTVRVGFFGARFTPMSFGDPLVWDMNGDGFHITSPTTSSVHFDIDNDGFYEQTAWFSDGANQDAVLAVDLNNNGKVDGPWELMSEYFNTQPGSGPRYHDGFDALRSFDTPALGGNNDGVIDSADAIYSKLFWWQDNGDGIDQSGEHVAFAGSLSTTASDVDVSYDGSRQMLAGSLGGKAVGQFYLSSYADGVAFARDESGLVHTLAEGTNQLGVIGGSGNDSIDMSADNLRAANGEAGDDTLNGTPEDDALAGGAGSDVLYGYAGNDVLYVDAADLPSNIHGGEGFDTVVVTGAEAVSLGMTAIGVEQVIGGEGGDQIFGGGTSSVFIDAGGGDDIAIGGNANDMLTGGDGADSLVGAGGTDVLLGDAGDDTLMGGSGNDRLIGGQGNDSLMGGAGEDSYYFSLGDGIDQVIDSDFSGGSHLLFGAGVDRASLVGAEENGITILHYGAQGDAIRFADLAAMQDTLLHFSDGATARLQDYFNHAPVVVQPAADQVLPDDRDFVFAVPQNTFFDQDKGDELRLSAHLADGAALPDWLHFDATTGVFTASHDPEREPQQLTVVLTATDRYKASATEVFALIITQSEGANRSGDSLDNTVIGTNGADVLLGLAGSDVLIGGRMGDRLDGGAGADVLKGGTGDDTYVVDNVGDSVVEQANAGDDTVSSSITWTLGAHVENLVLTGASAINGTGNEQANILTGNSADNVLDGGAGADIMRGGEGSDTYVVDSVNDQVMEALGAGLDTVLSSVDYQLAVNVENLVLTEGAQQGGGNELNNILMGNAANNVLVGHSGNDTLNGGDGADFMDGGAGDDSYVVNDVGDVVLETENAGVDQVLSSISYTLTDHVEDLRLSGEAAIDGTGNMLDNHIVGNAANNVLDGGHGADVLSGGLGDDVYVVDNASDQVIEAADAGTDEIQAWITYTAPEQVERLVLMGESDIDGTGNALDNVLIGNSASNRLDGALGEDIMAGGQGDDVYIIDNPGDVVEEAMQEGQDTVESAISYVLADNVEHMILTGTGDINGAGNALDNRIEGNAGDNVLDGHVGNDVLIGNAGDDTYVVDSASDQLVEVFDNGIDTVLTSVSYVLPEHVENMTLLGDSSIDGAGNVEANVLTGNDADNLLSGLAGDDSLQGVAGNDTLVGGLGNDVLDGGEGDDLYVYAKGDGLDVITDVAGLDTVRFGSGLTLENLTLRLTEVDGKTVAQVRVLNAGGCEQAGQGFDFEVGMDANDLPVSPIERFELTDGSVLTIDDLLVKQQVYRAGAREQEIITGRDDDIIYAGHRTNLVRAGSGNDVVYATDKATPVFGELLSAFMHGSGSYAAGMGLPFLGGLLRVFTHRGDSHTVGRSVQIFGEFLHAFMNPGSSHAVDRGAQIFGEGGDDYLKGGTGNDQLDGGCGIDVLEGGNGVDSLKDMGGSNLLLGGRQDDHIMAGDGDDFIAGGKHDDVISAGAGDNVIAFSSQDGRDTILATAGAHDTLSLGGGIDFNKLTFRHSGHDLVLATGGQDQITFKDWYTSTDNQNVDVLQVVAANDCVAGVQQVDTYDFQALVAEFDADVEANCGQSRWRLMEARLETHLGSSSAAALGGGLAGHYADAGTIFMPVTVAQDILRNPDFGREAQILNSSTIGLKGVAQIG